MSLDDILAELQKNYLAALPAKIVLLEELWKASELDKLETEYHKLKGTGRTYGLPEVTLVGAALERLCDNAPETLPRAFPLSLKLLTRIRETRLKGEVPELDHDPDFQVIVSIIENSAPAD